MSFAFVGFYSTLITQGGIGVRELMRDLAVLPHCNQEPMVVKDELEDLSGELVVSKSMECDNFSLRCSATVHWARGKNWVLICWWLRFDRSLAHLKAPVVTTTSTSKHFLLVMNVCALCTE